MVRVMSHDVRCQDGVTMFLPPCSEDAKANVGEPDVYAEHSVAQYPIGTLAWFAGMGKKFRYAKAAADMGTTYRNFLVAFGNYVPDSSSNVNLHGFYGPSAGNITTQAASGTGYQVIGELLCVTESGSASAFVNMDLDLGH